MKDKNEAPGKASAPDMALTYRFDSDGRLHSVEYVGPLTPETHQRIKDAVLAAREIGKGRT